MPTRSRLASTGCGDAQQRVTTLPWVNGAPKALGLLSAANTDGTTTRVATIARTETKIFRIMLSSSWRPVALSFPASESLASPIRVSRLNPRPASRVRFQDVKNAAEDSLAGGRLYAGKAPPSSEGLTTI